MSYIDKNILDHVNSYKIFLEQNINGLINYVNQNYASFNLFFTGQYKLFSIITENVRMDLNYLLVLNPDFDALRFPALKRNIRISIEAYYDLHNIVYDNSYYLQLLQLQSAKIAPNEQIINEYSQYVNRKCFNIDKVPLTITEKANIAKNRNNLSDKIYNEFKAVVKKSNPYIHPDIFIQDNEYPENILKSLVLCDCRLIMYAFDLLRKYIQENTPYTTSTDPYSEYNTLCQNICNRPWIFR